MAKIYFPLLLCVSFGAVLCGCASTTKPGPFEQAGQAVDRTVSDTGTTVSNAADEAGKTLDKAGRETGNAFDEFGHDVGKFFKRIFG